MPLPSSSPPLSRGEEGEKGSGGCGADGNNGSLLSAPVQQKQQQRQELVQGSGKGTEQSIDLLLRRDLSNFVAALHEAKRLGLESLAFLGRGGGKAKGLATCELIMPGSSGAAAQESHLFLIHHFCEQIDTAFPQ